MSKFLKIGDRVFNEDHVTNVELQSNSTDFPNRVTVLFPELVGESRLHALTFDGNEADALRGHFTANSEDLLQGSEPSGSPDAQARASITPTQDPDPRRVGKLDMELNPTESSAVANPGGEDEGTRYGQ